MNTRDCLETFLQERGEDLQYMGMLVNTTPTSYSRWRDLILPVGSNLLALRFFLKMAGYDPDELKSLLPGAYALAEAIVFGGLDFDTIIKATDMPPGNPDNVYKILCRGGKVGPAREQIFLTLAKSVEGKVLAKRDELKQKLGAPPKKVVQHVSLSIATAVKAVVDAQRALSVFVADDATRTQREALRSALKSGDVSIHDLWSTVDMLLTERGLAEKQQLKQRFKQ
ncbi:MAG: hypothetical protein RLZZ347_485 [Candidatus Parcubacteria bacterium]|jgi:hypothetical protein